LDTFDDHKVGRIEGKRGRGQQRLIRREGRHADEKLIRQSVRYSASDSGGDRRFPRGGTGEANLKKVFIGRCLRAAKKETQIERVALSGEGAGEKIGRYRDCAGNAGSVGSSIDLHIARVVAETLRGYDGVGFVKVVCFVCAG
jgi:hypothetical protein